MTNNFQIFQVTKIFEEIFENYDNLLEKLSYSLNPLVTGILISRLFLKLSK